MTLDFTKLAPWKNIETVTLDGEEMVRIPKFYVKVGTAPAGTDQSGKKCWWVSPTARKGYHVHPAFMHKGEELDQFYIGAYEAYSEGSNKAGSAKGKSPWVSITFDQSQAACEAHNKADGTQTGWHLQNLYERSAVALLCMLEIGSPDAQGKIGAGNSSSNAAGATASRRQATARRFSSTTTRATAITSTRARRFPRCRTQASWRCRTRRARTSTSMICSSRRRQAPRRRLPRSAMAAG